MEIGNFLVALVSMLAAAGATIVTIVVANRSARKERADADKLAQEDHHKLVIDVTRLQEAHAAMERAHNIMQGELAKEFDEMSTSQGDQFALLRDIQQKMVDYGEKLAANTATLLAVQGQLQRDHDRRMHSA